MNFSKSKYCALWQCPKMAWLDKYKPELRTVDGSAQSRMETGTEIGELSKQLFGDYEEATVRKPDGSLNLQAMIERTKKLMAAGAQNICEAAFDYNGLYCAVDILHKEGDGYFVCEVKSSAHLRYIYIADISYQKYVLKKCGVKVVGTYLININSDYVFDGTLNIKELFNITDVSEAVSDEISMVEENLAAGEKVLSCETEPSIDISTLCNTVYGCPYWDYCTSHIPKPSVFDLYRMPFAKKIEFYKNGIVSFAELKASGKIADATQCRQIDFALEDRGTYINKSAIQKFLAGLQYPCIFSITKPCSLLFRNS